MAPTLKLSDSAKSVRPRAFTLVELLVVIGIIAVLISILLPALNRARDSANLTKCRANLNQMGVALRMYANDNRDHFPNPESCGDPAGEYSYAFRRGVNEPDPTNPAVVETLGLPNLLFRLKYLPSTRIWVCPSNGGRTALESELNSFCWNVTRTNSGFTSKQRGRAPTVTNATTGEVTTSLKDWWYIQDNVFYAVWKSNAANVPSSGNSLGAQSLNNWYMPHQYRMKRVATSDNRARQGSTNVLFLDGSVGFFIYTTTSGFSPAEVLRGE